jgi:hypothetical protein
MADAGTERAGHLFKRVPSGWVFRTPNPWVFGDTPHYLVNEAQKAQIGALLTPRRPVVLAAGIIAAILGWVVAAAFIAQALSGNDSPTTAGDFAIITALVLIPVLGALPAIGLIQRHRLAPILAGAALTDQRISLAEINRRVIDATSTKQLRWAMLASAAAGGVQGLSLAGRLFAHRFVLDAQTIHTLVLTVVFVTLAFVWHRRLRQRSLTVAQ